MGVAHLPWGQGGRAHGESGGASRLPQTLPSHEGWGGLAWRATVIASMALRRGYLESSLVAQTVRHLPTMRETWNQSLGQEDLLEKEMATHSSILAWKIPWTEEPGRLQFMGSQRIGLD